MVRPWVDLPRGKGISGRELSRHGGGADVIQKVMKGRSKVELKVEYLSPGELTPYENNTRKHAPGDIEQIKESILQDGFNDPIGIWGPDNLIVEGHGRQIAAMELNLEKVPCIRLDHMTDEQRRDYAIRHNRTAELSAWDFTKLEEEMAQLEIEGHDFSGLKFGSEMGGDDYTPDVSADSQFHYHEQYAVTVIVKDEEEQREVYERLSGEGYECKVVCV